MKCPYCSKEELKVTETREADDDCTRRRRECLSCNKRFTTYERIELPDIIIHKKSGSKERFNRKKLFDGIVTSCSKRPVTMEQIDKVVSQVERDLRKRKSLEIQSDIVGKQVMKRLKALDKVAYIRFASVYQDFEDVQAFNREVKTLL